jgi:hypothetical protein
MSGYKFEKGNKMWMLAEYPGVQKKYTPEALWQKFQDYLIQNAECSWAKDDFIKSGPDEGKIVSMSIPNPPNIKAFCLFATITESTFNSYRKSEPEMSAVSCGIADQIQGIQISGAATNTFNANIVARWAGLVDKKELDLKSDLSDDERADMIRSIIEKVKKNDNL